MKKFLYYFFIIPFLVVSGCSKNPCDDLDNGVYQYPDPETRDKSEDIYEFFNIPDPILQCISTVGLIESCITYPHIVLVWTRNSLQQGFDYFEHKCNGFNELWRRNDKVEALFDLYSRLDFERDWTMYSDAENGSYVSNIIYHEIIIAQDEVLTELTDSQKLELFQLVLEKLKIKMLKYQEFGGLGVAGSIAILARIMKNEQYQPFIKKYENRQTLMFSVERIGGIDKLESDEVIALADDFLESLKK